MKVKVLSEHGYDESLVGISLSFNSSIERMPKRAKALAPMDGGHNKFLESICVWLDVTAPRYWWQQFDTYRVGITKQSESTMHTIMNRLLCMEDFERRQVPLWLVRELNNMILAEDFEKVKACLPEAFLQRRIICTNYKTLRHAIAQRKTHKLVEWREFIDAICRQVEHMEFLLPTFFADDEEGAKDE